MDRRTFIKEGLPYSVAGIFAGLTIIGQADQSGNGFVLRPPGAKSEKHLRQHCVGCEQCIHACPYQAIRSDRRILSGNFGLPELVVRETPCYMCPDLPCINSCPTEALDHSLTDAFRISMGTAVLTDRGACLSLNGIRCEICYRVCPLIDKAIVLKKSPYRETGKHTVFEPVIKAESCTGCGICEYSCPLDQPAIQVLASQRADKSAHYKTLSEQG